MAGSKPVTLGQRLQNLQKQARRQELHIDLSQVSMSELGSYKVEFGEKYRHLTFAEVWETDPSWVQFVASRYGNSEKRAHQVFLHYVRMKVERAEMNEQWKAEDRVPVPKTQATPGKIKPKAKAAPSTEGVTVPETSDSDLELVESSFVPNNPQLASMDARMDRLEEVLNAVIQQLSALPARNSAGP